MCKEGQTSRHASSRKPAHVQKENEQLPSRRVTEDERSRAHAARVGEKRASETQRREEIEQKRRQTCSLACV